MNGNFFNLTRAELIGHLQRFYQEHGKAPAKRDFIGNPDYPSISHYVKEFGYFGEAIVEAGLRKTRKPRHKRSEKPCLHCGRSFDVFESNKHTKFCSTDCRDMHRILQTDATRADPRSYRSLAIYTHGQTCERCGYDDWSEYQGRRASRNKIFDPAIIEVHHCDEDRSNNHIDNLAVLCPNCHRLATVGITRYYRKDGKLCWIDQTLEEWNKGIEEKRERERTRARIKARERRSKGVCDSPPHKE